MTTDQDRVRFADANGLRLAYESFGDDDAPAVLLIHGLGTQMLAWPEPLCEAIAAGGYRVVRFDNRDIGLSTLLHDLGTPDITRMALKAWMAIDPKPPYRLSEMAEDALSLMSALDIDTAHVVGASMGGMIAQHMASAAPERLKSLTMIMSSSGEKGLPEADRELLNLIKSAPGPKDREAAIQHGIKVWRALSSPAFPTNRKTMEELLRACAARCAPGGANEVRHLAAAIADGSRADLLKSIGLPSLIIHGDADPLMPVECGHDIARHIADAKVEIIAGMGHDLPYQLSDRIATLLLDHFTA